MRTRVDRRHERRTAMRRRAGALSAMLVTLFVSWGPEAQAADLQYVVIANQQNPTRDVSVAQLSGLLLGAKRYLGSSEHAVCVVLPPPDVPDSTRALLEEVLSISWRTYSAAWRRVAFSSQPAKPPKAVGTNVQIAMVVYRFENCIGLLALPADQPIPKRWQEKIRVLTVDGKKPGDPGYPLIYAGGSPRG